MSKKAKLSPDHGLSDADKIIGNPVNYGPIDAGEPAECVDGRVRTNRNPDLLVMRGPGGGLAFFYVRAALETFRKLKAIEAGTKHATTAYDVLDNSARGGQSPIPQIATFHGGICRRCAHGLQVDGRIARPDSHTREELAELSGVYAPRIGALASDLADGFDQVSVIGKHQVARLEARGLPSQRRLAAQVARSAPDTDNISGIEEEPSAHNYLLVHHRTRSLRASAVAKNQAYVDTPGAMVAEIQRTWELPKDELVIATAAALKNTLATRDTLTVAYPNGGMANYEANEGRNGGLAIVRHEIVIPDGFNV